MQAIRSHRWPGYLCVFALAITLTGGCSTRSIMVSEFVRMVQTGLPAVEQEQDLQLLAQSMPAHIKLMETLLASDPHNSELLILLARLYGGYAFAVLETEYEARHWDQPSVVNVAQSTGELENAIARYFHRGAQYALQALENDYPQARQQLEKPQSASHFIAALSVKDVPALFWYGFNLGGHIQHRLGSVAAIAKAHQVEKAMQQVISLDEAYYHGSAHLVLLAYYASRTPMAGGSPTSARVHFERHQQLLPKQMGLRQLYWARHILVQQQEREQYLQQLKQVAQALTSEKNSGLLASVAAARAEIYMGATDLLFD